MKIVLAYGTPYEIVDLVNLPYINTKAKIVKFDGETDFFDIVAGVLQEDTLAPYLFIIAMGYCMVQTLAKHPDAGFTIKPGRSRRVKPVKIADTELPDDIVLIADSIQEVQELTLEFEKMAELVGLRLKP